MCSYLKFCTGKIGLLCIEVTVLPTRAERWGCTLVECNKLLLTLYPTPGLSSGIAEFLANREKQSSRGSKKQARKSKQRDGGGKGNIAVVIRCLYNNKWGMCASYFRVTQVSPHVSRLFIESSAALSDTDEESVTVSSDWRGEK